MSRQSRHVVNVSDPVWDVYVGPGSVWSNTFNIGHDGDRNEIVEKYRNMVEKDQTMIDRIKESLRGKTLSCYCPPRMCHAYVLADIANS